MSWETEKDLVDLVGSIAKVSAVCVCVCVCGCVCVCVCVCVDLCLVFTFQYLLCGTVLNCTVMHYTAKHICNCVEWI